MKDKLIDLLLTKFDSMKFTDGAWKTDHKDNIRAVIGGILRDKLKI